MAPLRFLESVDRCAADAGSLPTSWRPGPAPALHFDRARDHRFAGLRTFPSVPEAGEAQSRNIGLSATVSARALKLAGNCFRGFFHHHGTRAQRIETNSRAPSAVVLTTLTASVGATCSEPANCAQGRPGGRTGLECRPRCSVAQSVRTLRQPINLRQQGRRAPRP